MMTVEDVVRVEIDDALVACDQIRGVAVDYLISQQRANEWDEHFRNACDNLRALLAPGEMRISLINNRLYEISRDHDNNIQVRELVRKVVR